MRPFTFLSAALLAATAAVPAAAQSDETGQARPDGPFTTEFFLDRCTHETTGSNPYYVLQPGWRLVLAGEDEGEEVVLVITVTDRTRRVNGVETRVVIERESVDGELVEISRNFITHCRETGSIVYHGEEVDFYENGRIVSHDGSWLAGENGAKAGILMPGTILLGARYFQEVAPGIAEDRAEILSMTETLRTPLGLFENVLKVIETTPLEPGVREFKKHLLDVGLGQDGPIVLIFAGFVS
ncbi:MAG TPA: hypothetical protein VIC56_03240 [Gemmatimonadota bacterium]|jgi:hypothetical protein